MCQPLGLLHLTESAQRAMSLSHAELIRGTALCKRRAQSNVSYWQKVTAKPSEKLNTGVPPEFRSR